MLHRRLLLGLLFGLPVALQACGNGVPSVTLPGGSGGAGDACQLNTDCALGNICVHHQCVALGVDTAPGDAGDIGASHDGLPCDVATLLQTRCDLCHTNPPVGGAPMPLLTYADLTAPSPLDATKTEAQRSVDRMQSSASPMPPGTHLAASDVSVLENWINAGMPTGSCQPVTPDGGPATDGGPVTIPDGGTIPSGLPCDLTALLQTNCTSCHSNPPTGGAPMPLLTYADLMAPSRANPSVTEAQQSVVRMTSTTAPMPSSGPLPAGDVAILQNWISAGAPQGTCQPTVPDAGLPDTPAQCSSGTYWRGNEGPTMRPGEACIRCHQTEREAPQYTVAGSVFPTLHEPDGCNGGTNSGARIIITDAAGVTLTLTPNAAGNFFSQTRLTAPIRASVQRNGLTRTMVSSPPSGDCNSCHTQYGASDAPGRIVPP